MPAVSAPTPPTGPAHLEERRAVIEAARRMNALGLNHGTSGNVGFRVGKRFLLTPSGLDYDAMTPADIVQMDFSGKLEGTRLPTSEWRLHRDILATRPEVGAVLHSHSIHCTTLAVHGMEIPAIHYMVAAGGGTNIRCAPYRTPTTQALSDVALRALEGRWACLLRNHGAVVLGATPDACVRLLVEVEYLAELYWRALAIADASPADVRLPPKAISRRKMAEVLEIMATYGAQPTAPPRRVGARE